MTTSLLAFHHLLNIERHTMRGCTIIYDVTGTHIIRYVPYMKWDKHHAVVLSDIQHTSLCLHVLLPHPVLLMLPSMPVSLWYITMLPSCIHQFISSYRLYNLSFIPGMYPVTYIADSVKHFARIWERVLDQAIDTCLLQWKRNRRQDDRDRHPLIPPPLVHWRSSQQSWMNDRVPYKTQ